MNVATAEETEGSPSGCESVPTHAPVATHSTNLISIAAAAAGAAAAVVENGAAQEGHRTTKTNTITNGSEGGKGERRVPVMLLILLELLPVLLHERADEDLKGRHNPRVELVRPPQQQYTPVGQMGLPVACRVRGARHTPSDKPTEVTGHGGTHDCMVTGNLMRLPSSTIAR